jgi:muconate cycloisomerase
VSLQVSISAGASISGIIDYIDLDSHYNLDPDPSEGTSMARWSNHE